MQYKKDTFKDFAERTLANLDYIQKARKKSATVFETTQLVNSMLGLITFPKERNRVPRTKLEALDQNIWPKASELRGKPLRSNVKHKETLQQVVTGIRHAVSHAQIEFRTVRRGSQSEIVGLRFWNDKKEPWELVISTGSLEKFIRALASELIKDKPRLKSSDNAQRRIGG